MILLTIALIFSLGLNFLLGRWLNEMLDAAEYFGDEYEALLKQLVYAKDKGYSIESALSGWSEKNNVKLPSPPDDDEPHIPEGWTQMAMLPRGKYLVIERSDGWHVYAEELHGEFS